ncbi:HTTM domain-containing protein [Winogradskyella immobilis]|uniref:HTTM domain-containing protein n=1 Tax=Winogradskyella immobilis TaxID=2816852 RepID=A0ABS8EME1_9FLAO|nr:HTTM domain-containing protein [Winogradskyella immobilis]MCC1484389.1 HTTM domain-containing protein [Winogradskyella immobilis]MCG0016481.1 HTTM domain-containing protein [Winogradskyella immobilis]
MKTFLFKHIDNSSLIVFRIIFGLLCFLESVGAIFTGWIKRVFIDPEFTFTFIGFEWLQPLPGNWMYAYYAIMGIFGFLIMIGYKYRASALAFAILWSCTYLMQKSSYNNHYYLLMVLSFIMVILPAHRYASIDVRLNPKLKRISMPNWCKWIFVIQLFIVYTYASAAKLYPDWLDASVVGLLMKGKANYPIIGGLLQQQYVHYFIAYAGILFDGLIIPLLLWKKTRKYAFFASIFFHLFNSIVLQIGIFPYLSLAFTLFFFDAKTIQNIFLKKKPLYVDSEIKTPRYAKIFQIGFVIFFSIQVGLPLRHYFIKDNVLWTEEGHRLSWRMMLRSKSGSIYFTIIDRATNNTIPIRLKDHLSAKQLKNLATKPDMIWQFSQRLKRQFAKEGKTISIYVRSYVSVNGKRSQRFIDPKVDLAEIDWNSFSHSEWILPSKPESLSQ